MLENVYEYLKDYNVSIENGRVFFVLDGEKYEALDGYSVKRVSDGKIFEHWIHDDGESINKAKGLASDVFSQLTHLEYSEYDYVTQKMGIYPILLALKKLSIPVTSMYRRYGKDHIWIQIDGYKVVFLLDYTGEALKMKIFDADENIIEVIKPGYTLNPLSGHIKRFGSITAGKFRKLIRLIEFLYFFEVPLNLKEDEKFMISKGKDVA